MTPLPIQEITYASSLDGTAPLYAGVCYRKDKKKKPIIAVMHGYNGSRANVEQDIRELAGQGLFCVSPDMRGRGGSAGKFDSGGLDVHDILDAILTVAERYPEETDAGNINIVGYSGGGGNTFSAFVRFPDLFHVAATFFGIADYGAWYRLRGERYGRYMDVAIGGGPEKYPLWYAARNAALGAGNNPSGLLEIFWDEEESACPPEMTEAFLHAYRAAGLTNATAHISRKSDAKRWLHGYRESEPMLSAADAIFVPKIFSPTRDLSLPRKGVLTVCGYVVTREFQIFVENGQRGVVKAEYDLTGGIPRVEITENPHDLRVVTLLNGPLKKLFLPK